MIRNTNEIDSVLVVDDDEVVAELLSAFLPGEGYRCETAMSAETALELLKQKTFDLMITDILLPGMNGLDLTKEARKTRPDMLVIVMTGFVDDFSYDNAIEAGAADFLKKPFALQEVIVRIKQAKAHRETREMSITDELTGLHNRRGFFTLMDHLLKMMKREEGSFSLLYADLNDFKSINDTLGHKEGDAALMDIAGILNTTFRESDIIARIGGDEFVVAPIRGSRQSAEAIIARLQSEIDAQNAKGNRRYKLSVSTGLAYYDTAHPRSIGDLLAEADNAMYAEKKSRQNL